MESETAVKTALTLTSGAKSAIRKEKKARMELEARLKRIDEEASARAAEAAKQHAEDQHFILDNRDGLLCLGRQAPVRSGRRTFANAGCVAVLSALVAEGPKTRDEILRIMWSDYRYSYRHAGFLLSGLRGPDPKQHLWYVDADRRFRLHQLAKPRVSLELSGSHLIWSARRA